MQSDALNSALSLVVYGDIVLSINTQYKYKIQIDGCYYIYPRIRGNGNYPYSNTFESIFPRPG